MPQFTDIGEAYRWLCYDVINGTLVDPRALKTRERINATFTIEQPKRQFLDFAQRPLNPYFASAELAWILAGDSSLEFIQFFNKQMDKFSDDGMKLHGAYGYRMYPRVHADYLDLAVKALKKDYNTRQAVVSIWRNSLDNSGVETKDRPCNTQIQFLIRNDKLHLIVTARSIDLVFGLPYDFYTFASIQKSLANYLEIQQGPLHYNIGSLHVYENQFSTVDKWADSPKSDFAAANIFIPKLPELRAELIDNWKILQMSIKQPEVIENATLSVPTIRAFHPMLVKMGDKRTEVYTHPLWSRKIQDWENRETTLKVSTKENQ